MRKLLGCMAVAILVFGVAAQAAGPADTNLAGQGQPGGDQGPRVIILPEGGDVLWDNGDTDGTNGYSNATVEVFGARRTLLDDFEIPTGDQWNITDFHWLHVWDTAGAPAGTDAELCFYDDAGGAPGGLVGCTTNTAYDEMTTGRTWFSRPEQESWLDFEPMVLGEGTYWFEGTIVGPDNNFWMVKVNAPLQECWVNYDDLGGLQSCSTQFGVGDIDMSWYITGTRDGGCVLSAGTVQQARPGQRLPVDLSIMHMKLDTIVTPFVLSIEDMDGNVIVSRTTRSFTMEYGKTVRAREQITLPLRMGRGTYNLVVSMDDMRGGRKVSTSQFRVR